MSVEELESQITSLQLEVDSLRETIWGKQDEFDKSIAETQKATRQVNTGADAESTPEQTPDSQNTETTTDQEGLTPEQAAMVSTLAVMQAELTTKEMRLRALKKQLAETIANNSVYFKKEEVTNVND